jgi:hydrogenase maturation protein HypF
MTTRVRARVEGRVQGVGFRPAVYRWAVACGLAGFVRNDPAGVTMDVEGEEERVDLFFAEFRDCAPPLADIGKVTTRRLAPRGYDGFEVRESQAAGDVKVHLPPDIAVCEACLSELRDPGDRRYRYPFINCVDCGPRFSIVSALPYDRPNTSMRGFVLCEKCGVEYRDPADRRFHAQPDACPRCGPRLFLLDRDGSPESSSERVPGKDGKDALSHAQERLARGRIVAVKGIGGYHLACDALNLSAIRRLRERKHRPYKALAVMFRDIDTLRRYLAPTPAEVDELLSPARPIVVVRGRLNGLISPDTDTTGAFLPYTPLHHLLLERFDALVMTSGNRRDEPIATDEEEARHLVGPIADLAIANDRPIHGRCDDSVVRVISGQRRFVRRSRGYVPTPIRVSVASPAVLATGADMKNTFCLTKGGEAYLSQHIGELNDASTLRFYRSEIVRWQDLLQIRPVAIAHDLHPGYLATSYARELPGIQKVGVQHHHAHIVSVLGERSIERPVLGVALDGTGYGSDGTIWGGEFLLADRTNFERLAHFKTYPLVGGDRAIEEPWRMAVSVMSAERLELAGWACRTRTRADSGGPASWLADGRALRLEEVIASKTRSPLTSSAGRLFDAAAALLGLCEVAEYEAQGAIRLETAAKADETGCYQFRLHAEEPPWVLDFGPAFAEMTEDWRRGQAVDVLAARFVNTIATAVSAAAVRLCDAHGLLDVALSGGVFQNARLLSHVSSLLSTAGLAVHTNSLVPPNDGGVSFGQAVVAIARLEGSGVAACA